MRIGIDARVLTKEKCGTANYVCKLVRHLLKLHPGLEIFLFAPDKICVEYEEYVYFPQVRRVVLNLSRKERAEWPVKFLPSLLKEHRVDVFHQPFNADGPMFRPPCPMVITIMDLIPWVVKGMFRRWHKEWRYKLRNILWTRVAKKVITISECSRRDIVRLCRVPPRKVEVTYLGADDIYSGPVSAEDEREILARHGLAGIKYFINMSGLNQQRRNPDFVLEGFAEFCRNSNKDIRLVFTGSVMKTDGFYDMVCHKMDILGIRGRVIVAGFLSDKALKVILSKAEVSIITSLYEGFCLPVTESFACAVPVIANSRGSIPEIAGDAAILVDPFRPVELAEGLKMLTEDPKARRALIEKGRTRVQDFRWDRMAEETLKIYEEARGKR